MMMLPVWQMVLMLLGAIGTGMILAAIVHCTRGRLLKGAYRAIVGIALVIMALVIGLVGGDFQGYSRLIFEKPIAEVRVQKVDGAQQQYVVSVIALDGTDRTSTCELQGDEWLLSARVQKWKPWVNLVGFDATYKLDQLSNKYFTSADGAGKPITTCDIVGTNRVIGQRTPTSWLKWLTSHLQMEDRSFGSANYMPLADQAIYIVLMTQAGLNAEPLNDTARAANAARP